LKRNYHIDSLVTRYERLLENAKTIEEKYDAIMRFQFLSVDIRPIQVRSEILSLLEKIQSINPEIIVEIGTNKGGTLALYANIAPSTAEITSIDLHQGEFGGGYPAWKIPFYQAFKRGNQKINLIRADSHKKETLDQLKTILAGKSIDYLFIDGDHTYEGVKMDFEMYSPLVRKGGLIAFHDVVHHPPERNVNIDIYMKELEKQFNVVYLVENNDQGSCGIAYIIKP
jgi:predicted O-methyltransferase YrrM